MVLASIWLCLMAGAGAAAGGAASMERGPAHPMAPAASAGVIALAVAGGAGLAIGGWVRAIAAYLFTAFNLTRPYTVGYIYGL